MPESIKNNDDKAIYCRFGPTIMLMRSIFFFLARETRRLGNIGALTVVGKFSTSEEKTAGEE